MKRLKSRRRKQDWISICCFFCVASIICCSAFVASNKEVTESLILKLLPDIPNSAELLVEQKPGPLSDSLFNTSDKVEKSKLFVELSEKQL